MTTLLMYHYQRQLNIAVTIVHYCLKTGKKNAVLSDANTILSIKLNMNKCVTTLSHT